MDYQGISCVERQWLRSGCVWGHERESGRVETMEYCYERKKVIAGQGLHQNTLKGPGSDNHEGICMKEECVCMCGISCVCVNECVRDMHFFHGHTTCTQSLFLQQPFHFLHLKYMKERFDKDWRVKEGLQLLFYCYTREKELNVGEGGQRCSILYYTLTPLFPTTIKCIIAK